MENKDRKAVLPNHLTLRAALLAKLVAGYNSPVSFFAKGGQSFLVFRVSGELLTEVTYFPKCCIGEGSLARRSERSRPAGRQIIVEEKIQCAVCFKLSSNLIAERTYLSATS